MNGVLICKGDSTTKNIGDYIQSVAQEQFWAQVDCYVEREALNTIESQEPINVIMNGWYMWKPQNFPPAECINPLFISVHINSKIEKEFFRPEVIEYLKRYEPIGARDKGTQRMLERHGVKSYFSACLTLTLGQKYKTVVKNDKIIFVDPYIFRKETPALITKSLVKASWHLLKHPIKVHKLVGKINYGMTRISQYSRWLDRHLCMASFYEVYSKMFDDNILFNAEYVSHTVSNVDISDDEKMEQARELVRLYAGAKLVITSRIHAALPCLAVETPVIFIPSEGLDATRENAGRFDGLEDLFHVIRWSNGELLTECEEIKKNFNHGKIGREIQIKNPTAYELYKDQLTATVTKWCKDKTIKIPPPIHTYPIRADRNVAIISFVTNSSHLNYGATLHGYAFQQVLHKKGISSVVIDYFPKAVEGDNLKYPLISKEHNRSMAKWIAIKLNWLIGFRANVNRYNKFRRFIARNLVTTDTSYTYESLRNV